MGRWLWAAGRWHEPAGMSPLASGFGPWQDAPSYANRIPNPAPAPEPRTRTRTHPNPLTPHAELA